MRKHYAYIIPIATILTIFVNFLSGVGQINNVTPQVLSDLYPVLFVPAGYVFSIWGVIYIGVILYSIYQFRHKQQKLGRELYVVTCLANISWIILWHYNHPVLSVFAMLALLLSLIQIYRRLNIGKSEVDRSKFWMVHVPISLYLGWISVATIANITVALYVVGFQGLGIAADNWSAILIIIASILGLHMYLRKGDFTFVFVIIWSLIGIGAKFQDVGIITFTSFVSVLLLTAIVAFTYLFRHEDKLVLKKVEDAN